MKPPLWPRTKLGKWSVGLNIFFLIGVLSAVLLTVFGILDPDIGHWWDIEVALIFPASILAFIFGLIAIKKKDYSVLVYTSTVVGLLTILFILLHSLFISD